MPGEAQYDHRDRCAIVGIGETDYSRNSGRSDLTLATQAALAAIADAGLTPADIDGLVRCDMDTVRHHDLIESIGMPNVTYWADVGPGRSRRGGDGRARPSGAILSGQATAVLVFRELNGRSGRRYGLSSATTEQVGGRRHLRRALHALRLADPRPGVRPLRPAPHDRVRHQARAARPHPARLPGPCQRQPAGADARPHADASTTTSRRG